MLNRLKRQKTERKSQSSESKTYPQGNDGLYAQVRHLRADLANLTAIVSVLKRDIARIDRKQYRDNGKDGPEIIQAKESVPKSGYQTNWG